MYIHIYMDIDRRDLSGSNLRAPQVEGTPGQAQNIATRGPRHPNYVSL